MKKSFGRILLFFIFSSVSIAAVPQETNWADIPMTSNSKEAIELYKTGIKAMDDVKINMANDCFKKASELEPNFVMPNIFLATLNFYLKNMDQFKEFANKALASTYKLNESEILMQNALKKLLEDPKSNVAEYGEKLVRLNPKSITAYQMLASYQGFANDLEGQNKSYQVMLQLTKNPAPIYNGLGYNYMALNKMDKAKEAFDKYIKSAPNNPNSYDSMGDYYAKIESFVDAHAYFMKAYKMDSINFRFSYDKANKLKSKIGY